MADNYLKNPDSYNADKSIKPRFNYNQPTGNDALPSEGEAGYPGNAAEVIHENRTTQPQNALKAQIFNEVERTVSYITNMIGNVHEPTIYDGIQQVSSIGDALRRLFIRVGATGMKEVGPRIVAMVVGTGIIRSQKTDSSGFTYFGEYAPSSQEENFFPKQGKVFDILHIEPDDPDNPSQYTFYIEEGFGITDSTITNPQPDGEYGSEPNIIQVIKVDIPAAVLENNAYWDHVTDDYVVPDPIIDGTTGTNEIIWTDHGAYLEGNIATTVDGSTWIDPEGISIEGFTYDMLVVQATNGLEDVDGIKKIAKSPASIEEIYGTDVFEICEGAYAEGHGGTQGGWDRPCYNARKGIIITVSPAIQKDTYTYYAYFKRYKPQWYLIQTGSHIPPTGGSKIDGINIVEMESPDIIPRMIDNIPLYAVYVDHPNRGVSKIIDLRRYITFTGTNDSVTMAALEERILTNSVAKSKGELPEMIVNISSDPPILNINLTGVNSYIYATLNGKEDLFPYVGNLREIAIHRSTFDITTPGVLTLDATPTIALQSGDHIWQPYKDGYRYHGNVTSASDNTVNYTDVNSGITSSVRELIFIRDYDDITLQTIEELSETSSFSFYRKGNFLYFPDGTFPSLIQTPDVNTVVRETDSSGNFTGRLAKVLATYEETIESVAYDVVEVDDAQFFDVDGNATFVYDYWGNTECLIGEILNTNNYVQDVYSDETYIGRTSYLDSTIYNDKYGYKKPLASTDEYRTDTKRILIWKTTIKEAYDDWTSYKFLLALPLKEERSLWFRDHILKAENKDHHGDVLTNIAYVGDYVGKSRLLLNPADSRYGYDVITGYDIKEHPDSHLTIYERLSSIELGEAETIATVAGLSITRIMDIKHTLSCTWTRTGSNFVATSIVQPQIKYTGNITVASDTIGTYFTVGSTIEAYVGDLVTTVPAGIKANIIKIVAGAPTKYYIDTELTTGTLSVTIQFDFSISGIDYGTLINSNGEGTDKSAISTIVSLNPLTVTVLVPDAICADSGTFTGYVGHEGERFIIGAKPYADGYTTTPLVADYNGIYIRRGGIRKEHFNSMYVEDILMTSSGHDGWFLIGNGTDEAPEWKDTIRVDRTTPSTPVIILKNGIWADGGNARGTGCIDLQFSRLAVDQVTTGEYNAMLATTNSKIALGGINLIAASFSCNITSIDALNYVRDVAIVGSYECLINVEGSSPSLSGAAGACAFIGGANNSSICMYNWSTTTAILANAILGGFNNVISMNVADSVILGGYFNSIYTDNTGYEGIVYQAIMHMAPRKTGIAIMGVSNIVDDGWWYDDDDSAFEKQKVGSDNCIVIGVNNYIAGVYDTFHHTSAVNSHIFGNGCSIGRQAASSQATLTYRTSSAIAVGLSCKLHEDNIVQIGAHPFGTTYNVYDMDGLTGYQLYLTAENGIHIETLFNDIKAVASKVELYTTDVRIPIIPAASGGELLLCVDGSGTIKKLTSSIRYKKNITKLDSIINTSKIYDLRLKSFNYIDDNDYNMESSRTFGLIVEEVEPIANEYIIYDNMNRPDGIAYFNLMYAMLNEIQKLNDRINILEKKKGV